MWAAYLPHKGNLFLCILAKLLFFFFIKKDLHWITVKQIYFAVLYETCQGFRLDEILLCDGISFHCRWPYSKIFTLNLKLMALSGMKCHSNADPFKNMKWGDYQTDFIVTFIFHTGLVIFCKVPFPLKDYQIPFPRRENWGEYFTTLWIYVF